MISNCPLNAKLRLMKVSCQCFRHIRVQLLCREWFCSLRSCLWMWQEVTYSSSSSSSVSSLCLQSAEWRAAYKHLAEWLDCFFFFFWWGELARSKLPPCNAFCLEAGELFPRNMSLTPILIHLWLHMHAVASLPSSIIAGPNAGRGPSLSGNALDLEREMNTEKGVAYISCTV